MMALFIIYCNFRSYSVADLCRAFIALVSCIILKTMFRSVFLESKTIYSVAPSLAIEMANDCRALIHKKL